MLIVAEIPIGCRILIPHVVAGQKNGSQPRIKHAKRYCFLTYTVYVWTIMSLHSYTTLPLIPQSRINIDWTFLNPLPEVLAWPNAVYYLLEFWRDRMQFITSRSFGVTGCYYFSLHIRVIFQVDFSFFPQTTSSPPLPQPWGTYIEVAAGTRRWQWRGWWRTHGTNRLRPLLFQWPVCNWLRKLIKAQHYKNNILSVGKHHYSSTGICTRKGWQTEDSHVSFPLQSSYPCKWGHLPPCHPVLVLVKKIAGLINHWREW